MRLLLTIRGRKQVSAIAQGLRAQGFGATKVAGEGQDSDAFVGVEDERTVYRGQFIRQTRR